MMTSDGDLIRKIASAIEAVQEGSFTEWLASVLVQNERLRQQITDVQAHNTALQERARGSSRTPQAALVAMTELRDAARGAYDAECVARRRVTTKALAERDEARERARVSAEETDSLGALVDSMRAERDEARALNGEMAAKLDRAKGDSDEASRTIGNLTLERDLAQANAKHWADWVERARAELSASKNESVVEAGRRVVRERDEAAAALVAANAAIAECRQAMLDAQRATVPPELARLYKAARKSLSMHGTAAQMSKLAEECGEYVAEHSRLRPRYDAAKVNHEIHDVLTVALSLCEPDLMAKAAERLEARLAT